MNPMWKMALFSGVSAIAAMLLRKRARRREALDVGTVSEEWLAQRRGVNDALL